VLVDEHGTITASATAEHTAFASPHTGWAEQDPHDWWRACTVAVRGVLHKREKSGADVSCIGLSGQMHGAVFLDAGNSVLRPALIWCDQRTAKQCDEINELLGPRQLIELTCNPALTNFTLTKLLWVRDNEPAIWKHFEHLLLPKDYVRLQLTGEHAIDVADASGTLMLDVARRTWSTEVLSATGIDERCLPKLYESPEICGRISEEGAAATGLRPGTPVVAGAGDQAAGAVGMGIARPGSVSATIGTSGVVFAATDRPDLDPQGRLHTFCHAIPDRWHVMGVTQAAGLSLRWFRDRFGVTGTRHGEAYELLCEEAAGAAPGADGVMWLPYLMGERTPHLDPEARAALVGLAANHGRPEVIRAILEGVAFSLRDTFTIFSEMNVPVKEIRLGGGGARSKLWRQIQADVYGQPVKILASEEGAAYGAALLAGVGASVWPTVDAACDAAVRLRQTIEPQEEWVPLMNERYEVYRQLYPAMRNIFHSSAG
jgi:xylulokinase